MSQNETADLIRPLLSLPKRTTDCWEGGFVRLQAWVQEPGVELHRPWLLSWSSREMERLSSLDGESSQRERRAIDLLRSFVRFAHELGHVPGAVEVTDRDLHELLAGALRELGVDVQMVDRLESLDGIASAMYEFRRKRGLTQEEPASPLSAPGVTEASYRRFFAAAQTFYRAAPSRLLSVDDVMRIELPKPPPGMTFAAVISASGQDHGLVLFRSHDDLRLIGDSSATLTPPMVAVHLVEITQVPIADSDVFEALGLTAVARNAYPYVVAFDTQRRMTRIDGETLDFVTGVLDALATSTEAEIDRARWEKAVDQRGTATRFGFTLPNLLEPLDQYFAKHAASRRRDGPISHDRFMADMARMVSEKQFASPADANRYLQSIVGQPMVPREPRDAMERAQDMVELAQETAGRRAIQIARRALATHADCVEAHELLGQRTADPAVAVEHFERAVQAGRRVLGERMFAEEVGHFWGLAVTRPYMRARASLAFTLVAVGRTTEAVEHFRDLLRLNPGDNQGNRYPLAACLLSLGASHRPELDALFAQQRESSAQWQYAKAVAAFARDGASKQARATLNAALRKNRHVPEILEQAKLPSMPESYAAGSPDEAVVFIREFAQAMAKIEGVAEWIIARGAAPKKAGQVREAE